MLIIYSVHKVRNYFVENCIFFKFILFYYIDVCYLLQNYVLKILFNFWRNAYCLFSL